MTKAEKEQKLMQALENYKELEPDFKDYFYIDMLFDDIAVIVFGCEYRHNFYRDVIYPMDDDEYIALANKIGAVINAMKARGLIEVSKSKKMFKVTI